MRIVHLSPFYHPSIGGTETFCRELSIRTARLGHEVHVITFTQADSAAQYDDGVSVHRVKPTLKWYKARFSLRVRNLVREIRPGIVHIQSPAPLAQELAIVDGCRYIATYHNDPVLTHESAYRMSVWLYKTFIFPMFYRKVDRIVSPSRSFQQTSEFLRLVPQQKKRVIPNGVDTSQFKPPPKSKTQYREKLGLHAQHIGIFVGSMEKWRAYKRVDILLKAAREARDIDVEFVLVGDGELRPRYEMMARELGCEKRVRFLGRLDQHELIESYWAADFLVLPSTSVECFPTVLLEAMACGLPVLTTNIPGPSDIVDEGITGYKINPGAPEQLLNGIKKLVLLDADKYNQMSADARKIAVERYDWPKVLQAYMREYQSLSLRDRSSRISSYL